MMRFRHANLPEILLLIGLAAILLWPSSSTALSGCLEAGGQWPFGPINVVASAGNLVVYSRGVTIEIADVTDPSNPIVLGATEITGSPEEIALSETLAFVAANDEGLFVIDFSDPTAPSVVGRWGGQTDQALDIAASGGYVFVASNKLIVLDVSNPTDPVEVARVTDWRISQLELVGSFVYATITSGLIVYDVSEPTTPAGAYHGSVPTTVRLAANDQRLLISGGNLWIYTLDDPASPVFEAEYDDPMASFRSVVADGTIAYLTTSNDEFAIVDTTDPANPSTTAVWASPGNPRNIAYDGPIAFLTTQEGGLRLINVGDPSGPTETGFIPATGASNDLTVDGDHAFVAQHGSGLRVFDVSDPDVPLSIGFVALDDALDVSIDGTRALVTGAEAGIFVVDISDPASPTLLGGHDTPYRAWKAKLVGNLAYVADGDSGLRIYNVWNPSEITPVGEMTDVDSVRDLVIADDVAYLADCYRGLTVVDVTNPSTPVSIWDDTWDNFCAQSIALNDNIAVLVEWWNINGPVCLRVYDVTNPAAPLLITDFKQTSSNWIGWDLAFDGDVLYVAFERATVAFNLKDPLAPALVARHHVPGISTGVDVEGGRVFIGAYTGGIASARCTTCAETIFADDWEEHGSYGYTAWSEAVP